ncbi:MAG: metallophosphoesterase [Elusimicrobiota bacterium]|nr:metallophosphoesterase [Elusimicrobiota bacterium]
MLRPGHGSNFYNRVSVAMVVKSTAFLHLSDIHFRPQEAGYDMDQGLRTAIENDIPVVREFLGEITGILVTGDIAYSGHPDEFRRAGEWLDKLCELAGCRRDRVWTTPGNHDVDRSYVRGKKSVRDFYAQVRKRGAPHVDTEINGAFKDELGHRMLDSIRNYNDFAIRYGCDVTVECPHWQQDIALNDGSILKLWGLTSTLISDENDHQDGGRLVIGSCQLGLPRQRGVETLTLCHHPLPWLLDQDTVETRLTAGTRVQLFGHKHSQRIQKIEETVRIIAGAVHPDRREHDWTPRYNAIAFDVVEDASGKQLKVSTHLRVWNPETEQFVADSVLAAPAGCRIDTLKLKDAGAGKAARATEAVADDDMRRLCYKFHVLDHAARCATLEKLGIAPAAGSSADLRFFRTSIQSLNKAKRLAELWDAINALMEDTEANPFAVRGEK